MIPRPIYRALPYLYLLAALFCAAWLQPPYGYFPAVLFAAAGVWVLVLRYQWIFHFKSGHFVVRHRDRKKLRPKNRQSSPAGAQVRYRNRKNPQSKNRQSPPAEEWPAKERRQGTERRTNTNPENFPLRDRHNAVIPLDRRKHGVRRRGV